MPRRRNRKETGHDGHERGYWRDCGADQRGYSRRGCEGAWESLAYLRDTPGLEFDFLSNLSAVDWPKPEVADKVAVENVEESGEGDVEEAAAAKGGFLEVVYHLYSQARRVGPLVLRARTVDRGENNAVASVSCAAF